MKLDHTINRNFARNIGLITNNYLNKLFLGYYDNSKRKFNKVNFNSKKFKAETTPWRFSNPKDFFPHDGHKKVYRITVNLLNARLNGLALNNKVTNVLSCTGKFEAKIKIYFKNSYEKPFKIIIFVNEICPIFGVNFLGRDFQISQKILTKENLV